MSQVLRHVFNLFLLLFLFLGTATALSAVEKAPGVSLETLPTAFVPNPESTQNQAFRFQAHALGGQALFNEQGVTFLLPAGPLRLDFIESQVGSEADSRKTRLVAERALPGVVNAFLGKDPQHWQVGLPTYGDLVYQDLYNGIDVVYNGVGGSLKSTYTVAPGVDPAKIRWRYDGASGLRVDAVSGDLHITLVNGDTLVEKAPIAWQNFAGGRRPVDANFVLEGEEVGFQLAAFDNTRPLVIDPTLIYSTYLGGSGTDGASAVAVDEATGEVLLVGTTQSGNFPLALPYQSTITGTAAFVVKLDPVSNTVIYSTYFGGSGFDQGLAIALNNGEAYIAGSTDSTNFPVTGQLLSTYNGGFSDGYVARFDPAGQLMYSTYLGGSSWDAATSVSVDSNSGEIAIAGHTESLDYPLHNAFQWNFGGAWDFFVTRLDAPGNTYIFSTFLGGSGLENDPAIDFDMMGDLALTGTTESSNFPVLNAFQPGFGGGYADAVVARFDIHGALLYSTYLGGSDNDYGHGIASHINGDATVVGSTRSPNYPLQGPAFQPFLDGTSDSTVTRLDAGGSPMFSTYLGGSGDDAAFAVDLDSLGNAYVTGTTNSSNHPLAYETQSTLNGPDDVFVTVLSSLGQSLLFSSYLGGSAGEYGAGIVAGENDTAYVVGATTSGNFPTVNPWQGSPQGADDAFLTIIETEATLCKAITAFNAIPNPWVIDFDNVPNQTNLATTYQGFGVLFENSPTENIVSYGLFPFNAASPPNMAVQSTPGGSSSNNPMEIGFTWMRSHVGMWVGNGASVTTATLRAYDTAGNLLCQTSRPGVPNTTSLFIGLHNPSGGIARVELDYGATLLTEAIDDLRLFP